VRLLAAPEQRTGCGIGGEHAAVGGGAQDRVEAVVQQQAVALLGLGDRRDGAPVAAHRVRRQRGQGEHQQRGNASGSPDRPPSIARLRLHSGQRRRDDNDQWVGGELAVADRTPHTVGRGFGDVMTFARFLQLLEHCERRTSPPKLTLSPLRRTRVTPSRPISASEPDSPSALRSYSRANTTGSTAA